MSTSNGHDASRRIKHEDKYYRSSYHSSYSERSRRKSSHRHRSPRHPSPTQSRNRSHTSRHKHSSSSSSSSSSSRRRRHRHSRSRSRSRSLRRSPSRRRKCSCAFSRSSSRSSNNYNKDKPSKSSYKNNFKFETKNNESDHDNKNKPTRQRKVWEEYEVTFIMSEVNKILNSRKLIRLKQKNWKSIALKLAAETQKRTNCMDLIGRTWQAVQTKYYKNKNKKKIIKNDENNDAIKMEFAEKPILIKTEHNENNKRKVKDEKMEEEDLEEMMDICKLLGIDSLKTNIQIYGYESHLNVYQQVLDLVAMNDESKRYNTINHLTANQLRDIRSKIKSGGICGRTKEMKLGIFKKTKELKVNYLKNNQENDSDSDSDNDSSIEPICKKEYDCDSGSDSNSECGGDRNDNSDSSNRHNDTATESECSTENQNDKKKERMLFLESLEFSFKKEIEKGLKLLSNMRIPDNENLQTVYINLLEKHMPTLKRCNADLYKHQNIDMREGN